MGPEVPLAALWEEVHSCGSEDVSLIYTFIIDKRERAHAHPDGTAALPFPLSAVNLKCDFRSVLWIRVFLSCSLPSVLDLLP